MIPQERFIYVPKIKPGNSLYNGSPVADKETYEILQKEGVEDLHFFLQQVIEIRKKVITGVYRSAYGLSDSISVFDFRKKILLRIKDNYPIEFISERELVGIPKNNYYVIYKDTIHKELENIGDRAFRNFIDRWLKNTDIATMGMDQNEVNKLKMKNIQTVRS